MLSEVAVPVSQFFRSQVPIPNPRRAVLGPKCRKSVPFRPKLPNRESYFRAVSSYRLPSCRVKWPWQFYNLSDRRFPFRTPGGPFWRLRVGKAYLFARNSLTVSLICEPPVPTGYSHLERSGRAGFRIFRSPVPDPDPRRAVLEPRCRKYVTLISNEVAVPAFYFSGRQFPFRTPGGPFWSVSVGKASLFTPNSLTVSPICEPSVSTGYSRLERSDRAGFGIFRSPVPDPDPRRPVLEPKCRKGVPFRPKHPNRESYLRAVSSYRLHSCCVKRPCQFYNYSERRFPFRTPDGPFWGLSVGKAYLFAPNSLTVGPICEPPVPPGYSHLERSGRAGFGNFRSPVPDPDPRRAVLEPRFPFRTPGGPFWGLSVGKAYLFAPNSLTVSIVCEPPVPTGYSNLERSGRASFAIFRSPVPNPDPQRAVLKPKCRKSVPFRPKLPNLTLISNEVAVPVSEFFGRQFPIRTPGGPFWSLSVGKQCLFAPNSLTVSPICKPSVPTGYTHLEQSGRAGFGIFRSPVPVPNPRRAVLEPKCRKRIPFRPKLPNRESYLRAACSYRLHSSRAKWPCQFRNFPFLQVTLTSSEVTAPVLEFSDRRFPFRSPGGAFWGLSVGKAYLFAPNSLTVSPIREPSVPTGYSHLERSGRAGFGIFRSPVPDPDPWRAVLKPKCQKSVPFHPKLPNRESYKRAVSSYRLLSRRAKWPRRF
ncbi:hypothetical protein MRB53_013046 [Persea americana]|nr:hypothetical protein MRB53_013046 [Persea americana]